MQEHLLGKSIGEDLTTPPLFLTSLYDLSLPMGAQLHQAEGAQRVGRYVEVYISKTKMVIPHSPPCRKESSSS